MDRGTWQSAVHRVTKSWTQPFTFTTPKEAQEVLAACPQAQGGVSYLRNQNSSY